MNSKKPDSPTAQKRRPGERIKAAERGRIQTQFLEAFAKSGITLLACAAASIHRSTLYAWLDTDPDFAARYALARAEADDVIRAEIYRRAIEGLQRTKSVAVQGPDGKVESTRVETVTDYSDTLLIFLAKARMPEFRERPRVVESADGNREQVNEATDEMVAAAAAVYERRTGRPAPDFSQPLTAPRTGDAVIDGDENG